MNVLTPKSLSWVLGSVALLAVIGAVLFGLAAPSETGPTPASAQLAPDVLTETAPVAGPVDTGVLPAEPEFTTVVEPAGGSPAVSGQTHVPASIEICYTDQQDSEHCKDPADLNLLEDWNPIRTQHTFTIRVRQANGAPAANVPVEVILNRFGAAVGDLVSLKHGSKVDNTFGNLTTNGRGEAEFVITSTREGDTDVTAYVPGIANADAHKVFAIKHWIDMNVDFPGDDTNRTGEDHPMTVLVYKPTDGIKADDTPVTPLEGVTVLWQITDNDPAGTLTADSVVTEDSVVTDSNGEAIVTLKQVTPAIGENGITMQVVDDDGRVMFEGTLVKTWVAQKLHLTKTGPASIGLLASDTYTITITNFGTAPATGLVLVDTVPPGMEYVTANPAPTSAPDPETAGGTITWNLEDLAANDGSTEITVELKGVQIGDQVNSATATSGDSSDSDSITTLVEPGAFMVSKACDDRRLINKPINCDVTVTNIGVGALTNVMLTDTPDINLVIMSSSLAAVDGTDNTWSLGTMMPNAERTVRVVLTSPVTGTHQNDVTVTSAENVPPGTAFDTIDLFEHGPAIDFRILDDPGRISVGEQTTLTATVFNQDYVEALDEVEMTITLPDELTVVDDGGGRVDGNEITFDLGTIAPRVTEERVIVARANARGQVRTIGEVKSESLSEPFPAFQFTTIVGGNN